MINLDMIFEKLENGIPLEEIERADRAEQKATYYERVAKLRKYK